MTSLNVFAGRVHGRLEKMKGNNNKSYLIAFVCLLVLVASYLAIVGSAKEEARRRTRAELFSLDAIKGRLDDELYLGAAFPTNWSSLSNTLVYRGELKLALPVDTYSVLAAPVQHGDGTYFGRVFLIRNESSRRDSGDKGRWALLHGTNRLARLNATSSTNMIYRIWINEPEVPLEAKRQIQSDN